MKIELKKHIHNLSLQKGIEILNILEEHGYDAYIVGGAVRDLITGEKIPDDIDISTNTPMKKIESLFDTHDIGANKDFGVVVARYKEENFDIAQFRRDGKYTDGRRPDTIEILDSFRADAERRDFTINAMAIDSKGNVIDYFNGIDDIHNRIIRTVGNPDVRFTEDYTRMLRAVRFSSRLNMDIYPDTFNSIKRNAINIPFVAQEKITKELFKMATNTGKKFSLAIKTLNDVGLLKHILPEIHDMNNYEHSETHHPEGNVYQHTLSALYENIGNDAVLNLSILFHDVGKIKTFEYIDGKRTFHQHEKVGSKLIKEIAIRMKLDNRTRDIMMFCALNHMKIHRILEMKNSKIVRLMDSPYWNMLLKVSYVDDRCRMHLFDRDRWQQIIDHTDNIKFKYANKENDVHTVIRKTITGELVMKLKHIDKPCKLVGDIIRQTIEWIVDSDIDLKNTTEIESYIKSL